MGGVVKSFSGVRERWLFRTVTAVAALALPVVALVAPASGAAAQAGGTARTIADTATCPWLNQSLPVSQRVSMLMAQMTLADQVNMVTGAGFSQPYVFDRAAITPPCRPRTGEED